MHIVFLVQRFPGYGGAEEYVRQLAVRLSEKGIDCTIVTSDLDKRNPSNLPKSVKVIKLPVILRIGEYAIWKGFLSMLIGSRADIFHLNSYGYFHTDATCLLRTLKKLKIVLTSHGFHGLEMYLHLCNKDIQKTSFRTRRLYSLRPLYDFTIGKNDINSADALVALSRRDTEIYKWMGAKESNIYTISQGVSDSFFKKGDSEVVAVTRQRIKGDPIILSVGELSWIKGKDIPLRALALMINEYPQAKLIYIGKDGGILRLLKDLAVHLGVEENVTFLGYVSSDQLAQYYQVADVLVHTSYAEGLSTVILEAIATGLPVISTPAGGNAHILQDSKAGIVVPFDDPTSVYFAIKNVLINDKLRKLFRLRGSRYASVNFRWNEVITKHMALYQDLSSDSN